MASQRELIVTHNHTIEVWQSSTTARPDAPAGTMAGQALTSWLKFDGEWIKLGRGFVEWHGEVIDSIKNSESESELLQIISQLRK